MSGTPPEWVGVVTGAANGIGRAVARRFAAEGGKVVAGISMKRVSPRSAPSSARTCSPPPGAT